ncbi:MAG: diacylglycerol kinase family lipid kinase [Clostridiales bacterium]|nr:diacylglycerol kinase family lipid kinase [Clostridiales bacterium]
MKTLLFLYNPCAGKGKIADSLGAICAAFQAQEYLVTVYATKGPGDAAQATRTLASHYDRMVCSGGDGTLSEVISGLVASEGDMPPLGYIPSGTTNDYARSLKIPTRPVEAAALAASGPALPVDVGQLNTQNFIYVAAFGAFTSVSYATPQEHKSLLGHAAYVLAGIRSLSEITSYEMKVSYDGGTVEEEFLYGMVSNSTSVGGFKGLMGDNVQLDDGIFEVLLIRKPDSMMQMAAILDALANKKPHSHVRMFQTRRVTFTSVEAVPWTTDGEFGGNHSYTEITLLRQAVPIVCGLAQETQKDAAQEEASV